MNVSVGLVDKNGNVLQLTPTSALDKGTNKIYFTAKLPQEEHLASYSFIQT